MAAAALFIAAGAMQLACARIAASARLRWSSAALLLAGGGTVLAVCLSGSADDAPTSAGVVSLTRLLIIAPVLAALLIGTGPRAVRLSPYALRAVVATLALNALVGLALADPSIAAHASQPGSGPLWVAEGVLATVLWALIAARLSLRARTNPARLTGWRAGAVALMAANEALLTAGRAGAHVAGTVAPGLRTRRRRSRVHGGRSEPADRADGRRSHRAGPGHGAADDAEPVDAGRGEGALPPARRALDGRRRARCDAPVRRVAPGRRAVRRAGTRGLGRDASADGRARPGPGRTVLPVLAGGGVRVGVAGAPGGGHVAVERAGRVERVRAAGSERYRPREPAGQRCQTRTRVCGGRTGRLGGWDGADHASRTTVPGSRGQSASSCCVAVAARPRRPPRAAASGSTAPPRRWLPRAGRCGSKAAATASGARGSC